MEHAELASGDGMSMIGPERSDAFGGRAGNGWTYVVVEGNLWSFGTYRPGA